MLEGKKSVDDRGAVSFVNDFDFKDVKRFYIVENHQAGTIRAWHGHQKEGKYIYVVSGAAIVGVAPLDGKQADRYTLSADNPTVLWIPPGNYNGFKTLTPDTKVIFYSTATLEESQADDIRLDWDGFGTGIWEVQHR